MATEITLTGSFLIALIILAFRNARHMQTVPAPGAEASGFRSLLFVPGFIVANAARIGMSAMLILTGVAHFVFTEGMVMMLPEFVPLRPLVIYATGIFELAAAVGLLIARFRRLTAWALIIFLVLLLPSNIYAAMHHVNMQTAGYNGNGPEYLWYRVPLQLFFIGWIYFSAIKISAGGSAAREEAC